ncbi:hypothetical protein D3C86_2239260 [compost metagenome]
MPVCDDVSRRIVCLPLYHSLTVSDLDLICRIILRVQNNQKAKPIVIDGYDGIIANNAESAINGHYIHK